METAPFRALLAEDDPVSREFLIEAMRACGAEVTACADGLGALELARTGRWHLLLLDQHLPGLTGHAILAALDADGSDATRPTAIAITAAADDEKAALLRAGFAEVLPKPMSMAVLQAALRRHGCAANAALDDDAALRACGSEATVARLRHLFVEQELPAVLAEIDRHPSDTGNLRATLHRLRASCGFCGADTLATATAALQHALAQGDRDGVDTALGSFRTTLGETRDALRATLGEV
ncbi:MAG: response regulator [Rhodanobacteraceae bacterium]